MPMILVITDDAPSCSLFNALLNLHGYTVIFGDSDPQGLELFRLTRPDAVVLDLNIPQRRANLMLREVRRLNASQPVIILTEKGASQTEECVHLEKRLALSSLVKILGCMLDHRLPEKIRTLQLTHSEWTVIS
jgi:DNA-binding response OmpR family regulator